MVKGERKGDKKEYEVEEKEERRERRERIRRKEEENGGKNARQS